MIKEKLVLPYIDLNIKYFDLSITNRDATNDKVCVRAQKKGQLVEVDISSHGVLWKKGGLGCTGRWVGSIRRGND
jgi:isocitrate dehydrogenase